MFITFEGMDGSGKTTQLELLIDYLKKQNYDVIKTRESRGTKTSEEIKELVLDKENKEIGDYT